MFFVHTNDSTKDSPTGIGDVDPTVLWVEGDNTLSDLITVVIEVC